MTSADLFSKFKENSIIVPKLTQTVTVLVKFSEQVNVKLCTPIQLCRNIETEFLPPCRIWRRLTTCLAAGVSYYRLLKTILLQIKLAFLFSIASTTVAVPVGLVGNLPPWDCVIRCGKLENSCGQHGFSCPYEF